MAAPSREAWAERPPTLWAWMAVGMAVDAAGLSILRQAGLALPLGRDVGLLVWQMLALMAVAWMAHVAVVPALLWMPRRRTPAGVAGCLLAGMGFVLAAGLAACVLGITLGALAVIVLLSAVTHPSSPAWAAGAAITAGLMAGAVAGGVVAGRIAHWMRGDAAGRGGGTWRLRSDVGGAAAASGLFAAWLLLPGMGAFPTGDIAFGIVWHRGVFPVAGTLALLPHLLLLGLDLRRAGRA